MQFAKVSLLAAAVALAMVGPAFASSCPKHMAAIDAALAKNPSLSAEQLAKAKELRAQGEAEHKAGKHKESMDSLSQAEQILGIK